MIHRAMEYVTTLHPPYLNMKDKIIKQWSFNAEFKPNRTYLLQPGCTMEDGYYLETGIAILYSIEPKTNELKILYIWEEKSLIILCGIFKESLPPGDYYIKLIADAELVRTILAN